MKKMIKGRVVVMKKNVFDLNDLKASVLDRVSEFLGQKVSLQLIIAAINADDSNEEGLKGKLGKPAYLENWITTITPLTPTDSAYSATFDSDDNNIGIPVAFLIKNLHHSEFYLKTLTLQDVPGQGQRIHFVCNSWVYPSDKYTSDRVFFSNQAYLPHETPEPLIPYREEELRVLRGNGTGMLEKWDRVYDYAFYNDLGDPDKNPNYARPVLGGSSEFPYPRRGRTGRSPTKTDPNTESRLPLVKCLSIYVPSDERFGHVKLSDFLGSGVKSIGSYLLPKFESLFDSTPTDFDSIEDLNKVYEGGIKIPFIENVAKNFPCVLVKELIPSDGQGLAKYPVPEVIKADKSAWRTDEEFAREMLAGVNPVCIRLLQEFPPTSKLDTKLFGKQNSSINKNHIEKNLDGIEVEEAIKTKRLFILDHPDTLMPYLSRINATSNATSSKIYASRTLLFLQNDGTLKPIAIELSLPHSEGANLGAISNVYIPAEGVEGSIWQLAKAYVAVNDSGVHQLISHWLNTHAVIEPFVIATNRQLSVLHPIHKLLKPHIRDTMNINAFARQILINGGGILEKTVFPGRYSLELSSVVYKDWVFPEQALPNDLLKRGMADEDPNSPHGLRLVIEDYPYAVDGLKIWSAIKTWVTEYCNLCYKTDEMVQNDPELQSWWKEIRKEGHGDKKNEPWWPKMHTQEHLVNSLTTFIWVASAVHAAVNFGQYPYAGYFPNRPTISRKFMPELNTPEYEDLKDNPDKVFLKTIAAQLQALLGIALIELLSRHSSAETYLGQTDTPEWTNDIQALEAFERFGKRLREIEGEMLKMNGDERLKNRNGPVKVPYTLLYPTSEEGLTGKGIPNSVSM